MTLLRWHLFKVASNKQLNVNATLIWIILDTHTIYSANKILKASPPSWYSRSSVLCGYSHAYYFYYGFSALVLELAWPPSWYSKFAIYGGFTNFTGCMIKYYSDQWNAIKFVYQSSELIDKILAPKVCRGIRDLPLTGLEREFVSPSALRALGDIRIQAPSVEG